jgi:hypothetical protein
VNLYKMYVVERRDACCCCRALDYIVLARGWDGMAARVVLGRHLRFEWGDWSKDKPC